MTSEPTKSSTTSVENRRRLPQVLNQQSLFDFEQSWRTVSVGKIYSDFDQKMLADIREDSRIEWKSPGVSSETIAECCSMWANMATEGGLVVVGIDKDGNVVGCCGANVDRINHLEKAGFEKCPQATYESKRVRVTNCDGHDDFVIVIRVHYNPKRLVRTAKGEAWVRRGDSKVRLSEEDARIIEADRGQVEYELEPCCAQYPDDFNIQAIDSFVSAACKFKGWDRDRHREDFLTALNLGSKKDSQFYPNIACLLLFGTNPRLEIPGSKVRFLRFEGDHQTTGERANKTKDISVEGTLPEIIRGAESVLTSQLREFEALGPEGTFVATEEYPRFAWLEAIVNAVSHRSYLLKNMCTFVRMYDDRLEVESPGGFMPLVTAKNIYEVQHARNPWIMEALQCMGFVQCRNEGVRRMRDLMTQNWLPAPEFAQEQVGHAAVRVTLRNAINQRKVWRDSDLAMSLVDSELWELLNADQRRILNYIAENGKINKTTASVLIGKNWHFADRVLKSLMRIGVIDWKSRFSRDSKAHYILCAKEENI